MPDDPLQFAETTISAFKAKANHNKSESLFCFTIVVGCSLVTPLFVTLGDGLFWGKILPSMLSLSAAASTAWLQLRKPQNLWSLYRDCQRRIEDHVYKYKYHLAEYQISDDERLRLLADAVRTVAWDAHQRWLPLVPTPEAIGTSKPTIAAIENEPPTKS
jgi:Protein of unknown function (DUF4231)